MEWTKASGLLGDAREAGVFAAPAFAQMSRKLLRRRDMGLQVAPPGLPFTGSANPLAIPQSDVVAGQRMAEFTDLFFGILLGEAHATHHVHLLTDRIKVGWVHAATITAEMIKIQALRDRTTKDLIAEPVHQTILGAQFIESISAWLQRAEP